MSSAWTSGSTRRWRHIRAHVLERNRRTRAKGGNDGRCRLGIKGVCTGKATCVHHVLGRSVTGDDPRFLVASCKPCNLHVGNPQVRKPQPRKVTKW